jgi:hypothetical protein
MFKKITKLLFCFACLLFIFGNQTADGQKTDVSVIGFVRQIIFEENPVRYEYFLISEDGKPYRLSNSGSLANYVNRRVSLSGEITSNLLNVKGSVRVLDENRTLTTPPPTFGSRKILVILVKLTDTPTPMETVEDARKYFYGRAFGKPVFQGSIAESL